MSEVVAPAAPAPAAATTTAIDNAATKAVAAAGEKAEQTKTIEEFFDIKVDGKSKRMSREEVLRRASLADAADNRFEEAAAMRKQAEGLLSRMRNPKDAIALLQDPALGLDKEQVRVEFESWYKAQFIDREAMTPEQRELADAKERIKKYEETEAEVQKNKQSEEDQKADMAEAEKLQKEILGLLDTSGLPKTKFTAGRLAYWIRVNETKGLKAPAELIIDQVKKEAREVMSSMVQNSDGDVLLNLLGEDTAKKIRKYDLERIRARRNQAAAPGVQQQAASEWGDMPKVERISEAEVKRRARAFK